MIKITENDISYGLFQKLEAGSHFDGTSVKKPLKSMVYSVVFCHVYTMIRMRDVPYLDHERDGANYKKILLVPPL